MAATVLEPQKKKTRLMTEGSIWKSILLFSVPLILGNLLQQLYNTADSIIVGNFVGSNALAAVGSSGSPIFLLIGFSQGIAVGAGVVVAQYLGAKDREDAQRAVHTALALAVLLGLILTIGGILVSRALLTAMDTPAEVLEDAVTYMQIYFGGVLFSVVYNMAAGILNAAGNSQRSLLYLGIASGTNILLDLVLIAGLRMGVAGAAIATDISQLVSCALALRFLMRVQDDYRVTAREIRVHGKMAVRIIKVGLPTGIQNMVISLSNILVQAGVNGYGAAAMAGFAAYMKVDGFNILPIMSFSMAATTFVVAEALRRGFSPEKINKITKYDLWFLDRLKNIVDMEDSLDHGRLDSDTLRQAKEMGFSDAWIAALSGREQKEIKALRESFGIRPAFKMVDTCAAEFEAQTEWTEQ